MADTISRFPPCRTGAPIRRWCGRPARSCEPFAHDQAPSPLIHAMPDLVHSPLRVARPSVRASWLRHRGAPELRGVEGYVEVEWDMALRLVHEELQRVRAEHGPLRSSAALWLVLGRPVAPCPHADAPIPLRRRRLRGPGRQLQLGRGPVPAAAHHRHLRAGDGPRHRLEQRGGQYAAADRLWRHRAAQHADHVRRRRRPSHARLAGAGARGRHADDDREPSRGDAPEALDAEWVPIRPNTDAA